MCVYWCYTHTKKLSPDNPGVDDNSLRQLAAGVEDHVTLVVRGVGWAGHERVVLELLL